MRGYQLANKIWICISGVQIERDGLGQALMAVGEGDALVVWKLDRLGRSLNFLIDTIKTFGEQGRGGYLSARRY